MKHNLSGLLDGGFHIGAVRSIGGSQRHYGFRNTLHSAERERVELVKLRQFVQIGIGHAVGSVRRLELTRIRHQLWLSKNRIAYNARRSSRGRCDRRRENWLGRGANLLACGLFGGCLGFALGHNSLILLWAIKNNDSRSYK